MVKSTQLIYLPWMSVGGSRSDRELHKKKFKKTRVESCLGVDWMCTLGSESKKVGVQNNPSCGRYFHTQDWIRAWRSVCQTRRRSYFFEWWLLRFGMIVMPHSVASILFMPWTWIANSSGSIFCVRSIRSLDFGDSLDLHRTPLQRLGIRGIFVNSSIGEVKTLWTIF